MKFCLVFIVKLITLILGSKCILIKTVLYVIFMGEKLKLRAVCAFHNTNWKKLCITHNQGSQNILNQSRLVDIENTSGHENRFS